MAVRFECEIRYAIRNIAAFEGSLNLLGAKLLDTKQYNDHYLLPSNKKFWNKDTMTLRLREWIRPPIKAQLLFGEVEIKNIDGIQFKRSIFPGGKQIIWQGNLSECDSISKKLGFEPWISIEKPESRTYDLPKYGFITAVEHIENFGWSGELEFQGENLEQTKREISRSTGLLGILKQDISFKPLSVIYAEYAEKNGLL